LEPLPPVRIYIYSKKKLGNCNGTIDGRQLIFEKYVVDNYLRYCMKPTENMRLNSADKYGWRVNIFTLAHPESFAMGYTQNLAAMGTKVNITLSQNRSKLTHPYGSQFRRTMRTNRFDIIFDFESYHFGDYVNRDSRCK